MVPTATTAGSRVAIGVVLLMALTACGQDPTSPSTSPTPDASPTVGTTPAPPSLTEVGDRLEIEAADADGPWGAIALVRQPDVGGYRLVSDFDLDPTATDARAMFFQNDPDAFYVELEVTYRADRIPESYGSNDWLLTSASGTTIAPIERGGIVQDLAPNLPGTNLELSPSTATLVFAVPRDAADEALLLVYRRGGVMLWRGLVRDAGAPPAPVATIVPPLPVPEGYLSRPDVPISVLFSTEADDLFSRPDTCTNPEGYTVTFPDDWWTNTAIGDVPACSWFSPTFFEVPDPTLVPDEVVISISVLTTSAIGMGGQELPIPRIESIRDRSALRNEQVGVGGGFMPMGSHAYTYQVWLEGSCCDERELSVIAVAGTGWQIEDDPARYILHKAILDRIMASMTFED